VLSIAENGIFEILGSNLLDGDLQIGKFIPGLVAGDQKVADRWASYASDNSYHPTASEKAGRAPKMQSSKGRFTARDTNCNCGPIGRYPGSNQDRGGK
jgi:hypothetical protein